MGKQSCINGSAWASAWKKLDLVSDKRAARQIHVLCFTLANCPIAPQAQDTVQWLFEDIQTYSNKRKGLKAATGTHSSPWYCEVLHMYNPHRLIWHLSKACLLGLDTVRAATHILTTFFVPSCAPAFDIYVSRRDRQCVFSLPPPFFPWHFILVLHTQHCFSFTVQPNRKSMKQKRSKHLSDPTLTMWKLHHFSVARSSTSKSWWMGDGFLPDQFGIIAGILQVLEMMMQRYLNAKSTQVNQARAADISPEGWEGGGSRTLNHHAEYFTLGGAGNPAAVAWNSLWRQPGLGSQWIYPATIRCTGVKGFCRSQPGPKLSLWKVAQVSVHHASGVLQYWESQPCISPAGGELSINQCLFSIICL